MPRAEFQIVLRQGDWLKQVVFELAGKFGLRSSVIGFGLAFGNRISALAENRNQSLLTSGPTFGQRAG